MLTALRLKKGHCFTCSWEENQRLPGMVFLGVHVSPPHCFEGCQCPLAYNLSLRNKVPSVHKLLTLLVSERLEPAESWRDADNGVCARRPGVHHRALSHLPTGPMLWGVGILLYKPHTRSCSLLPCSPPSLMSRTACVPRLSTGSPAPRFQHK